MKDYKKIFAEHGLHEGRMISGSKSGYMLKNKENLVVFNARICTLSEGVIWWGDLDTTKSEEDLKKVSSELGEPLFVLRESDAWYEDRINEELILSRNVIVIEG